MRAPVPLRLRLLPASALFLTLAACNQEPSDVIGQAFVAPATLNLRSDLAQKATTVAVLKHAEQVQILDIRRRFVEIRTAKGAIGWVDATQLLNPEQMRQLQRERERALKLPSEGLASVYEPLNIHLDPSRQSPAFARIPEAASVEVLEHKLLPRLSGPPKAPVFNLEHLQPPRRERKKKEARQTFHLPPKPPPPKPPPNWEELSAAQVEPKASEPPAKAPEEPPKAAVLEDWTLVRTKDRDVGWVLTRNIFMSIPDEVAQYGEGKRITSYFSLGQVRDEEKGLKQNWLWTTLSEPASFDFDGWRVFLWNRRRHRYETSHRQRDLEGYFPVAVDGSNFSLITKDDDGKMRRRSYNFDGVLVHLTNTEDYHPDSTSNVTSQRREQPKLQSPGWLRRMWSRLFERD